MLRIFLVAFFCAGFVTNTFAATAKWQSTTTPLLANKPQSGTLSNGDKTVTDKYQALITLAVDFSAKRAWIRHNKKRLWWDGSSSNVDIASVTGFDLSSLGTQAVRFGLWLENASGSGCSARLHTTATEIQSDIPSGYSAWDDIVGTTTINTGTAVNVTITESDKAAAITATGAKFETTSSLALGSTGKAVIEIATNNPSNTNVCEQYFFGLLGASFNFSTDLPYASANSATVTSAGVPSYWYYNSTPSSNDADAFRPVSTATDPANYYRLHATNIAITASKTYFEVDVTSAPSTFIGVTDGNVQGFWSPFNATLGHVYPGRNTTDFGVRINDASTCYTNESTTTCNFAQVTSFPRTIGVAVDQTNNKIWYIHNQSGSPVWYGVSGSPDPTTNTGGLATWLGTFGSGPLYAAVGLTLGGNATINGGSSGFTYSSAYSSLVSAGYTMLDTPAGGNRGFIFGANGHLPPFTGDRCRLAA